METSCCLQPLTPFYFKGSLLILRFICNELSGQDSACLCSYLHENLSLIILMKMEMHFFLLLCLDSGVKGTAGISERISAGYHLHDEWYLISDHLFWQEGSSSRQPEMWIWVRQIWSFAKLGWGQQWVLCSVPASCAVAPAQALLAASLLMAWWSSNCLVAVTLWDCIFISSLAVVWGITLKILLQWWWHLSTLVVPSHRAYKRGAVVAFCFWPSTKSVFLPCYLRGSLSKWQDRHGKYRLHSCVLRMGHRHCPCFYEPVPCTLFPPSGKHDKQQGSFWNHVH